MSDNPYDNIDTSGWKPHLEAIKDAAQDICEVRCSEEGASWEGCTGLVIRKGDEFILTLGYRGPTDGYTLAMPDNFRAAVLLDQLNSWLDHISESGFAPWESLCIDIDQQSGNRVVAPIFPAELAHRGYDYEMWLHGLGSDPHTALANVHGSLLGRVDDMDRTTSQGEKLHPTRDGIDHSYGFKIHYEIDDILTSRDGWAWAMIMVDLRERHSTAIDVFVTPDTAENYRHVDLTLAERDRLARHALDWRSALESNGMRCWEGMVLPIRNHVAAHAAGHYPEIVSDESFPAWGTRDSAIRHHHDLRVEETYPPVILFDD